MQTPKNENKSKSTIYLFPNLLTTGGLFAGFYAVIAAMKGLFDAAAIAICVSFVMDSLDGRVARLTGSESDFGKEYDSLSDMVAFGVAPALVAYSWGLHELGKIGWLAAFFYTATAGLRLARFNVQELGSKQYFYGLPTPAAAAAIAATVGLIDQFAIKGQMWDWALAGYMFALGAMMVSSFPYYSFKELDLKHRVPFFAVFGVVLLFIIVSYDPPKVVLAGLLLYIVHGPLLALKRFLFRPRGPKKQKG